MPRGPRQPRASLAVPALARLAARPPARRWIAAAVSADLLRSLGPRQAWLRRRQETALQRLPRGRIRTGYREIWLSAALQASADAVELPGGFIEFRRDDKLARVWHSWVPLDDAVTVQFADHKPLVHQRLAAAGVTLPEQVEFGIEDASPALAALARSPGPWVLKPLDGAGGSGATSGVRTERQFVRALLRAARLRTRLVLQRQVRGRLHRLLFLDGELLDAIERLPPRVTGDGRSTIAELVAAENARRLGEAGGLRVGLLRLDLDAVFTLGQLGYSAATVLAAGERVAVKTVVNQNSAADNTSVRDRVSPDLVAEAAAAVAATGVRLAGVDLITEDPGRALAESGGALLEVNATPGIHYHYEVSNPQEAVRVAEPILERLLA